MDETGTFTVDLPIETITFTVDLPIETILILLLYQPVANFLGRIITAPASSLHQVTGETHHRNAAEKLIAVVCLSQLRWGAASW